MSSHVDRKIEALLRLPWTLEAEITPEGDRLLRCREIPSAIGTGATDEEIEADFWTAMEASLRCYLHFDDPIPLPEGHDALPWEHPPAARPRRVLIEGHGVSIHRELNLTHMPGTALGQGQQPDQLACA